MANATARPSGALNHAAEREKLPGRQLAPEPGPCSVLCGDAAAAATFCNWSGFTGRRRVRQLASGTEHTNRLLAKTGCLGAQVTGPLDLGPVSRQAESATSATPGFQNSGGSQQTVPALECPVMSRADFARDCRPSNKIFRPWEKSMSLAPGRGSRESSDRISRIPGKVRFAEWLRLCRASPGAVLPKTTQPNPVRCSAWSGACQFFECPGKRGGISGVPGNGKRSENGISLGWLKPLLKRGNPARLAPCWIAGLRLRGVVA